MVRVIETRNRSKPSYRFFLFSILGHQRIPLVRKKPVLVIVEMKASVWPGPAVNYSPASFSARADACP